MGTRAPRDTNRPVGRAARGIAVNDLWRCLDPNGMSTVTGTRTERLLALGASMLMLLFNGAWASRTP
ncbi:hypothetical protein LuPra_00941 [Luteitalea pratensis]|uniref:Uncharacterized protein n=1 Tax=Luteitalea pratensis TaxID=1855912 RepID=A0A143PHK6_LUTPR|nr:hypothetical protein LuPra_00941 [Luteitalea pratensis]